MMVFVIALLFGTVGPVFSATQDVWSATRVGMQRLEDAINTDVIVCSRVAQDEVNAVVVASGTTTLETLYGAAVAESVSQSCQAFLMYAREKNDKVDAAVKQLLSIIKSGKVWQAFADGAQNPSLTVSTLWSDVQFFQEEKDRMRSAVRKVLENVKALDYSNAGSPLCHASVENVVRVIQPGDSFVPPEVLDYVVLKLLNEGVRQLAQNSDVVSENIRIEVKKALRDFKVDVIKAKNRFVYQQTVNSWKKNRSLCVSAPIVVFESGKSFVDGIFFTRFETLLFYNQSVQCCLRQALSGSFDTERAGLKEALESPQGLISAVGELMALRTQEEAEYGRLLSVVCFAKNIFGVRGVCEKSTCRHLMFMAAHQGFGVYAR